MCSTAPNFKINMEDLVDHTGSSFERRCLVNDINKYVLEYIFEKKSDYIIFDILDARAQLLCNGNVYITVLNQVKNNRSKLNQKFGLDTYTEVSPFDISNDKWNECIDVICKRLLQHYSPNQIIINKHFGVPYFYDSGLIKDFPAYRIEEMNKYNPLVEKLFSRIQKNIPGCHVIDFPNSIICDGKHKWGLYPLHYHSDYYEYASKAIEVIIKGLPYKQELIELNELKLICEGKQNLLTTSCQIKRLNERIAQNEQKYNITTKFIKEFCIGIFHNSEFSQWVEKSAEEKLKIALVNCGCDFGDILIEFLKSKNTDLIFTHNNEILNDEEISYIKQADIIISADLFTKVITYKSGLCIIPIKQHILHLQNQKYVDAIQEKIYADCLTNTELKKTVINIYDAYAYLEILKQLKNRYLIVLAVKDHPGVYFTEEMLSCIYSLGFNNFRAEQWRMYVGVVENTTIYFDRLGEKAELPVNYENEELKLKVSSNAWRGLNKAEIVINGVDYACNFRGLNIVIYDTVENLLIDSVAIDMLNKEYNFKRKI